MSARHGFVEWFDRRSGIRGLLHEALDEPIPGGARWAYVFGSGLILLFLSQVITGVFLALYYVPSADHAHTTVAYIVKEVSGGSLLRSVHAYGSSAMIVVLFLHIGQTILWGSYKRLRELLWLVGCVLFALILGMAFTGYLLPWDQKAYFATAVGTNIMGEIPFIGFAAQRFIRGGTDMGTLTVSRFFVSHVFLLPAAIFTCIGLHVYLFRKAGAAGPPTTPAPDRTASFYPRQVLMDMGFSLLLIAGLAILGAYLPIELGPEANPADTRYIPRPEWYYVPVFQWLKYWKGSRAIVGIVVIPGALALLFAGLPFFDRGPERRAWRRPGSVGGFLFIVLGLAGLGVQSYAGDRRDPAIGPQLEAQQEAVRTYMAAPFEPDESAGSLKTANTALADPVRARGKAVFESQSCDACHGADGHGTIELVQGVSALQAAELEHLIRQPNPAMKDGGMTPLEAADADVQALVVFVKSLK